MTTDPDIDRMVRDYSQLLGAFDDEAVAVRDINLLDVPVAGFRACGPLTAVGTLHGIPVYIVPNQDADIYFGARPMVEQHVLLHRAKAIVDTL